MIIVQVILITSLLVGIGAFMWNIAPSKSKLVVNHAASQFPIISGFNLERKEFEFPKDFTAEINLVIIPFKQHQQNIVNTWIPAAEKIEEAYSNFIYYELPTIYELPVLSRTFINEGMRAGISSKNARQRTITLYLDKEKFKSALNIPTEDTIYLYLVSRDGEIIWATTGSYSSEKGEELLNAVNIYSNQQTPTHQ